MEVRAKRVKETHVNIVDLVESRGQHVRVFDSVQDLSTYTKDHGKYFPKETPTLVEAQFLLRAFLTRQQSWLVGPARREVSVDGAEGTLEGE